MENEGIFISACHKKPARHFPTAENFKEWRCHYCYKPCELVPESEWRKWKPSEVISALVKIPPDGLIASDGEWEMAKHEALLKYLDYGK